MLLLLITDSTEHLVQLLLVGLVVNVGLEAVDRLPDHEEARLATPEAAAIADARLAALQQLSYARLAAEPARRRDEVTAAGRLHTVEIKVHPVAERDGGLRVWVLVDDGVDRRLRPLARSFVMRPDGSVIVESGEGSSAPSGAALRRRSG